MGPVILEDHPLSRPCEIDPSYELPVHSHLVLKHGGRETGEVNNETHLCL